ncbi:unnamed protein product [Thelazia callipaeda]|uniref:Spore coat protein n=1 Tax=Thelazia callipaeda TaxID=103827 RepID=A0A0N5D9W0_THECL|nr:unnamed protein product [Thelazia callipaeda]
MRTRTCGIFQPFYGFTMPMLDGGYGMGYGFPYGYGRGYGYSYPFGSEMLSYSGFNPMAYDGFFPFKYANKRRKF